MFEHFNYKIDCDEFNANNIKEFLKFFEEVKKNVTESVESAINEWNSEDGTQKEKKELAKALDKFKKFEFNIANLIEFFEYWQGDHYCGYSTSDNPPISRFFEDYYPDFEMLLEYF